MPKLFNQLCEEMLAHWLERRKKFKLLFESETSKNVPHDFHSCCDKKGPTVSIFFADNSSFDDTDYLLSPWTHITDSSDEMKAEIEDLRFSQARDHVKILLVGQRNAGQSSYIHSIGSAFRGYVTSVHSTEVASRTVYKGKEHQIRSGRGLNLKLCESPGLESSQQTAAVADSLMKKIGLWVQGLIDSRRKSNHLQSMHGIVFVIDGNVVDDLPRDIKMEFDQWKDIANRYKIPQTVVLTKIDLVCSLADKDLSLVLQSSKIADLVGKAAELMGLPRSNIFPVKNYVEEIELEKEVDRLTLFSLRQMLRFIQDRQTVDARLDIV